MKKVFTFILALAMAATLFAGCAKTTADDTPGAGQVSEGSAVLTVALPAAPAYLDPTFRRVPTPTVLLPRYLTA